MSRKQFLEGLSTQLAESDALDVKTSYMTKLKDIINSSSFWLGLNINSDINQGDISDVKSDISDIESHSTPLVVPSDISDIKRRNTNDINGNESISMTLSDI